jgi:hypothetical protein
MLIVICFLEYSVLWVSWFREINVFLCPLSTYLSTYLPTCLPIFLPIYLPIYPSIHLSMGVQSFCWTLFQFLGRGISLSQGRYLRTGQTHAEIHALSRIRTHDPSVRVSEDTSCLRESGHCDLASFLQYSNKNS